MIFKDRKGEKMGKYFKKGQSILEYTLLLGAIIAVIVAALLGSGGIQGKVRNSYNTFGDAIETTTADLTGSVFR
jgi:Flp pilus assembly pilin Flp